MLKRLDFNKPHTFLPVIVAMVISMSVLVFTISQSSEDMRPVPEDVPVSGKSQLSEVMPLVPEDVPGKHYCAVYVAYAFMGTPPTVDVSDYPPLCYSTKEELWRNFYSCARDTQGAYCIATYKGRNILTDGDLGCVIDNTLVDVCSAFPGIRKGDLPKSPPDTTRPVLTVPSAITKYTSDPSGLRVYYPATATDTRDRGVSVSCSPISGSEFSMGNTRVSCIASDDAGNSVIKRFTVTVMYKEGDNTAPVITVPYTIRKTTGDSTGLVVEYSTSALDDTDGDIEPTCSPESGSTFSVGSTTVSCEATDSAGNRADKSFVIRVAHAN